jgi:tetratricopeptide (TPR) repeat protein
MIYRALILFATAGLLLLACDDKTQETAENSQETAVEQAVEDSSLLQLNRALARNPRDPNAYYERALYWQEKKELQSALADLKSALLLDTNNANYFYTLGELYFGIGAFDEADEVLRLSTEKNPQLAKAYVKRGEFAFYQKLYNSAMKYVNDGLRQDINYADGYFWKGMIYLEQNNPDKAISSFQTAIEQDPTHHEAYMQLGLLFAARKDNKAHAYFTNALRTNPQSTEALYARAMFLQEKGYADSARQDYNQLLEINPQYANALFNMGYLSLMEENFTEAINWFNKALDQQPAYYEALYNRGLCYELSGQKDKALTDFKRVLSLEPNYTLAASAIKRLN